MVYNKHLKDNERKILINMVFNGSKTIAEAAADLQIRYKTACKICSIFSKEGRITKKRTPKKRIFGAEVEREIIAFFESHPAATLSECRKFLVQNSNDENTRIPSASTIDRIISAKRSNLTRKRVSLTPVARNTPETIEQRKSYAIRFSRLEGSVNSVFLDEFGCNASMRRMYGRSKRGAPVIMEVDRMRSRNMTVCAAIDLSGPIHFTKQFSAMKEDSFCQFLTELIARLDGSRRNVLIFDNLCVHKTKKVRDLLHQSNQKYLCLPPYSPMLNPIEQCFSKVKNEIRSLLGSGVGLFESVDRAFAMVTPQNVAGWYRDMERFFPQCLSGESIHVRPIDSDEIDEEWSTDDNREILGGEPSDSDQGDF